jgi:outer membrane protein, heavy metal efflux system
VLSSTRAGCCCAMLVVAVASFHATANAAPTPPDTLAVVTGPLTLERVLALARQFEPRLRPAGLRAEAARARIREAGRRPNPTLSATEENFGGQLGGSHREATAAIGQTLELGGDRRARIGRADAEYRLAAAETDVLANDGVAVAVDRFIAAWTLQTRLRQLREGEYLTEQAIRAATERFKAGASPRLEILRAQSQALAQVVERQQTSSELEVARRELAFSWGASRADFDSLVAPDDGDPNTWRAQPQPHPELTRASANEALAIARVHAAKAARIPDLVISAGARRLEEIPGSGFVAGVEVPVPLWNRGTDEVAAARRELEASTAERRTTEQRLQVARLAATERLHAAAAVYDTLRLRVRPARAQVVEELLRGYRAGRSSYLDLVAEQNNLLQTELALTNARADLWRARMRLALLPETGLPAPKEER